MYGCMNDWLKNNILKIKLLKNLQKKVVTGENYGQILKRVLNDLTSTKKEKANLRKNVSEKFDRLNFFVIKKLDKLRVHINKRKMEKSKCMFFFQNWSEFVAGKELNTV